NINNSIQWVLVRGNNVDAPSLIHVQAGPGLPMISEANEMEKRLHLEDRFLVAYWDQRGCGKSFSKDIPPETITLAQMADDIIACTKYLLKKYNKSNAVIVSYSIGATISLMAAAKDSSIFTAIFAAGVDVDIPYANHYALDFAMDKAIAKKNKKMIQKINELKRQPIVESKRFQQRAEILTNLGGINAGSNYNNLLLGTLKNILFSRYYGIGGLIKTMRGMALCQNALIPEMNSFNLFQTVTKVSVPIHFIQGNLDGIAAPLKGKEYYEQLHATNKSFTLFERSAHMPQYEEPEKFSNLIVSFLNY
ncbi:MAG TPA: alpha/beta hydrolase, partial [Chitinophagaceae bacterium]|nr:alpha/beta hydrolase [Chitinophagaceae bacterium]